MERINVGDVLSESSHYVVERIIGDTIQLVHHESGQHISIDRGYVKAFLHSADEVNETVEVTKEDKKDGTPGIRTIFEGIHSGQVFTVCFKKQDKQRSKKAVNADIEARTEAFVAAIDRAKAQKKSISDVARKHFSDLMLNPILGFEEGEDRILRGYKVQFESRDGKYNCVDMDIERTDKESGVRPVNINSLKWLIFNGVKYVVK